MEESRRTAVRTAVFSTWVVAGLFLDGWAHNAGLTESFWSPWHGVLYSGFAVAAITFVRDRRRARREGSTIPAEPLVVGGFALFAAAGLGDAVWHSIFGIEEDVAALLSPTHLVLMLGGLLLIAAPLRVPVAGPADRTWRTRCPEVVALTLTLAVVGFFLQFLSPFHGVLPERYGWAAGEPGQLLGVAAVLVTNALLLATVAAALRRPGLPVGALTAILGVAAVSWTGLEAFETVELVLPVVVAGAVGDLLLARRQRAVVILVALPVVLWLGWFATYHAARGLGWPVEFWTGVTALAALTGWGVALLGTGAPAVTHTASSPVIPGAGHEVHAVDRGAPAVVAGGS